MRVRWLIGLVVMLLICAAPGAMPADTSVLPWTQLRPGIRIKPNGAPFIPATKSRSTG